MRRWILAFVVLGVVGVGACTLLLPDGLVVKGPILNSILGRGRRAPTDALIARRLRPAEGLSVSIFADGIENARFMRLSPGGSLLVSQPRTGRILLVERDADGDGRSDGNRVLVDGLDRPHGLDFRGGHLYVGETGAIARIPYRESGPDTIEAAGPIERIVEGLPPGGNHWSRTLRFGPDGGLYLHVGSSCNVCEEEDPRRATILRFEPDGSGGEIYASGLRNSVGFDWQPGTNDLYATDNGRDLLGDDFPPCELNRIERGGFYGWPWANGDNRPDPDLGAGHEAEIARAIPPAHGFRAHNAPLGISFVRDPEAPAAYRDAALVALHGSWNRSELDGYKVVSLHWNPAGDIEERDFLTGFAEGDDVIGRPVDVIEAGDGRFYVSDDYAGVIYRMAPQSAAEAARASESGGFFDRFRTGSSDDRTDPLAALPAADRRALASRGASLFDELACGTCHVAAQAEAGAVVKPLRELAGRYTLDALTAYFLTPQSPMPIFDLPEADRRALAVHLLETHGD
ncbi:MAG: PQQ-dependent sugar dehydrogenase [Spirochaetaceae bacterium]|nr:PQQ-dependent sugar dehydrogenase [Myxococcales bacterium]MCB9722599.1 PQQ-dependent sugar dehydrogenase [Spirochaetaceae bacterium]